MDSLIASGGQIAVVSSLAGHVGIPFTAAYGATKHALHGFFESLTNELSIMGIRNVGITLCVIGATDTEGAAEVKRKLTKVTFDPASGPARAIVSGVVLREREIFHPHHLVFPLVFINSISPALAGWILRLNLV